MQTRKEPLPASLVLQDSSAQIPLFLPKAVPAGMLPEAQPSARHALTTRIVLITL